MINMKLKVELTEEFLRKTINWIVCKYMMDDFKREQSSSKRALLGGFIDRWMNKAPEFLIFNELLKNKDYSVVNDTFFYTTGESKNAPDVLGLVDENNNCYPFAKFNNNNWDVVKDTPFIEMKTFRGDQKLVTIPFNQFHEDHYYVIVESHLEEDYLLSIFDKKLFDDKYYEEFTSLKDNFIIANDENVIKEPSKINYGGKLGYYNLLGIYKGKDLLKYSKIVKKGDRPLYFLEESDPPLRFQKRFEVNPEINLDSGINYFGDDEVNIPFDVTLDDNSGVSIKYRTKKTLDVEVNGKVMVDNVRLSEGMRRLQFREFEKNGDIMEVVTTKSILEAHNDEISAIDNLIKEFDDIKKTSI